MKRSLMVFFVSLAFLFCAASGAYAAPAPEIVTAGEPDKILAIAKKLGKAELTADKEGDPRIKGTIKGIPYSIYFYDCKENKDCKDISFSTYWTDQKVSPEVVNKWSVERGRYAKAHVDEENDPWLRMRLNLDKGVTVDNLRMKFLWWIILVQGFEKEVLNMENK